MSKKQLKFPELSRAAEAVKKGFDSVVSVLIFGSAVKGKELPTDMDICVITDREVPEQWPAIKKQFPDKTHLTFISSSRLLDPEETLTRTMVHEGFDLIHNCQFSEVFGFRQFTLFMYSLAKLGHSTKTRFMYAFKGRGKEPGLSKKMNGRHVGKGVISIPVEHEREFEDFLESWKIDYEKERVLMEV